jgi:hypothetical protein
VEPNNARFGETAQRLADNGYSPLPLIWGKKNPPIKRWQKYQFAPDDAKRHSQCGTGILCGQGVVGVDIDILRQDMAAAFDELAVATLGKAPKRIGKAPKCLRLYRIDEQFGKIQTPMYRWPDDPPVDNKPGGFKGHKIEVLADGQQFVAYNNHPDTGRPYTWNGAGSPLEINRDDLPLITKEQAQLFVNECERRMVAAGATRIGKLDKIDTSDSHIPNKKALADDPDACRAVLATIPNADEEYDHFIKVMHATKAALGEEGLEAFLDWSRKSKKHNEEESISYWRRAKPTGIGAGTLYYLAQDAVGRGNGPAKEILPVSDMLRRFVLIEKGPTIVDRLNPRNKWRSAEFKATFAASTTRTDDEKRVANSTLWLTHRNRVTAYDISFDPGEGTFFQRNGQSLLNMWNEPNWPDDVDVALATPFLAHIDFLVPDKKERADLLDWLAAMVQQPGVRPHFHFLLFTECQGIGRSWLGDCLRELWGEEHATHVDLHQLFEDSFNPQLSRKILVYVSETKAPPSERFAHRERMNSLFTDNRIRINEKHIPAWEEKFCARFLMFTNSPNALPLAENDRRVYVARCPSTPKSAEYYKALYGQLADKQFLAAVWKLLKARDISSYNPGARAPLSASKLEMAEGNRTIEQQDAVTFMRTAPFDVILAPDLDHILAPPMVDQEKERGRQLAAIRQALQGAGAATATHKLKVRETIGKNGSSETLKPVRVWILKNVDQWREATTAKLKKGIEEARTELKRTDINWSLSKALAAWSKDEIIDVEKDY